MALHITKRNQDGYCTRLFFERREEFPLGALSVAFGGQSFGLNLMHARGIGCHVREGQELLSRQNVREFRQKIECVEIVRIEAQRFVKFGQRRSRLVESDLRAGP